MASHNTSSQNAQATSANRTLQRLRRAAGYRSAKEFALVLGIPSSTYSRYENRPDGPEKPIPLSAAWLIADALRCSIDAVVGREDIDKGPGIQEKIERLSPIGKSMLSDYLEYLQYRESKPSKSWR